MDLNREILTAELAATRDRSAKLEVLAARLVRAIADHAGGPGTAARLDAVAQRFTVRQLAARDNLKPSTLHIQLTKARGVLAEYGVLPRSWMAPPPGPRPRVVHHRLDNPSRQHPADR